MALYLGAADVFALPTLYDPMPNAALEALAAGLPVPRPRPVPARPNWYAWARTANASMLDIPGMAAALGRLLAASHDPAQQAAISAAARASVAHMSNETMAAELVALYRQLELPVATKL